jgi:hypothetical protein
LVVFFHRHHPLLLYLFQDPVVEAMVRKELKVFKVLKEDKDSKAV